MYLVATIRDVTQPTRTCQAGAAGRACIDDTEHSSWFEPRQSRVDTADDAPKTCQPHEGQGQHTVGTLFTSQLSFVVYKL